MGWDRKAPLGVEEVGVPYDGLYDRNSAQFLPGTSCGFAVPSRSGRSESVADRLLITSSLDFVSQSGSSEKRELRQFQFMAWPDHGVPEYPTPILAFLRRVKACNPLDAGPMVVHCR